MQPIRTALAASLGLTAAVACQAATYYVDSATTKATQNGSSTYPFKTLKQLNDATQASGSIVRLKCGGVWYETLVVKSGVTYDASTSSCADKPVIRGSDPVGALAWQPDADDIGGKVWWADASPLNAAEIRQIFLSTTTRLVRARHPNIGAGSYAAGSRYDMLQPGTQRYGAVVPDLSRLTQDQLEGVTDEGWDGARLFHWFGGYMLQELPLSASAGVITAGSPGPESTYQHLDYNHDAGTPYYLENRRWMLDADGEWFYDAVRKRLYLQPAGNVSPSNQPYFAATRRYGISAVNAGGFALKNIEVRQTIDDAVHIENPGAASFTISGLRIVQAGMRGIYVKGAQAGTISGNTVTGSRSLGIALGDFTDQATDAAANVTVSGNTVTGAGEQLYAVAAIKLARGNTASGNTVQGGTGIGILGNRETKITGNTLNATCQSASDCGAIYVLGRDDFSHFGYPLNTEVSFNRIDTVQPSEAEAGRNAGATGIYLDDFATTATVKGNFVTKAGIGMVLHYGRGITVTDNFLVGNRVAQLKLLEADPNFEIDCGSGETLLSGLRCDARNFMVSSTIQNNVFVALEGAARLVHQKTWLDSTDDFADYSGNAYVGASATPFYDETGADNTHVRGTKGWSFGNWQSVLRKDQVSSRYWPNLAATTTTGSPVAMPPLAGGYWFWGAVTENQVDMPNGTKGWHFVVPDAARGLSGLFTTGYPLPVLSRGQSYLVSFDAKAQGGSIRALMRETVEKVATDAVSYQLGGDQWTTYARVIDVTEGTSVPAQLVLIFDTPEVTVANIKVVPLARAVEADSVKVFDNWGTADQWVGCGDLPCSAYLDARTGKQAAWPLKVGAKSARVLVRSARSGVDADLDGVPDGQDNCAATAADVTPNAAGCKALVN